MVIIQLDSEQLHCLIQNAVREVISEKQAVENLQETDQWFNLAKLCDYLLNKPRKITVFVCIHSNLDACHKKWEKLRFLEPKIDKGLRLYHKTTTSKNNWIKKRGKSKLGLTIEVIRLIIVLTKFINVLLG